MWREAEESAMIGADLAQAEWKKENRPNPTRTASQSGPVGQEAKRHGARAVVVVLVRLGKNNNDPFLCWVAFLVRLHHSVTAESSASHSSDRPG
jgi:hypothetical protein